LFSQLLFWRLRCLQQPSLLTPFLAAPLPAAAKSADTFAVVGGYFVKNKSRRTWRGADTMFTFGGSSDDMSSWGMDIAREVITNMRDNPITGEGGLPVNGQWLHPLQKIVSDNRANGLVTILCPFGWDGTDATKFLGRNPSQTPWWQDYKVRYREIARQFKNQPDVWLEVWNEPFWWDRSRGYSDELWLMDMRAMVDNIRSTGAQNIVLVPGAEMGQDERVILKYGPALLRGCSTVGFDVHAYEKWLGENQASVVTRVQRVQNRGCAMLFGEIAPRNGEGSLMNPAAFLEAARCTGSTVCAWLWKHDATDVTALLNEDGTPNTNKNNNWGLLYKAFTIEPH